MFTKLFKAKKGMVDLQWGKALILGLAVIGIVGAISVLILQSIQSLSIIPVNSYAYNIITLILQSIYNFFSLAPVLGIVLMAVLLLSAVAFLGYAGYNYVQNK